MMEGGWTRLVCYCERVEGWVSRLMTWIIWQLFITSGFEPFASVPRQDF